MSAILHIPDMTCAHCETRITAAVRALDPAARLEIDLPRHEARLESTAELAAVLAALDEAGYPAIAR